MASVTAYGNLRQITNITAYGNVMAYGKCYGKWMYYDKQQWLRHMSMAASYVNSCIIYQVICQNVKRKPKNLILKA
ncbi:hypothetical protein C1645_755022 [Glomus cerebriforme]|uniref:Uncharacterized protein n=1 Tax=Glomus cerebriforme TaxID=658196 RepID=A0A397THJ3_9GLOM|nr:hypothetical protein C1645_755022 [Glomus cerebriforme]